MLRPLAPFLFMILCAAPFGAKACTMPADTDRVRAQVLMQVNAERAKRRLPPLRADQNLARAAQDHACDTAHSGKMSHRGSDGSDLSARLRRVGYDYNLAAENVAKGYSDPAAVMKGWMSSTGHRRNILTAEAVDLGLGIAIGKDGAPYWVLDMARPQN
jgi:uncharacterized protein YkwD